MKTLTKTISALAFGLVLALSLAANTTDAFAANTNVDAHGPAIERGSGSGNTLSPFDALGVTWE